MFVTHKVDTLNFLDDTRVCWLVLPFCSRLAFSLHLLCCPYLMFASLFAFIIG